MPDTPDTPGTPSAGPSAPVVTAPGGVIHDIGYRHYDGPRLGRAAVVRSLVADGIRGAYGIGRSKRSRIIPFLLLGLACIPALIWGLVVTIIGLDDLPVDYVEYIILIQVLIAIFVASQAPVLVSRDLRHRVVSLYFSRPLGRMQYVFARYTALSVALFAFIATPVTLLFLCGLLAKLPIGEQLPDYLRALATAALLALLVSGIALVIAAFTVRRGLGVAAIITLLLLSTGLQAFVGIMAEETGAAMLEEWAAAISPFGLVDSINGHVLRGPATFVGVDPSWTMGVGFVAIWLALVATCMAALALRYRKVGVS